MYVLGVHFVAMCTRLLVRPMPCFVPGAVATCLPAAPTPQVSDYPLSVMFGVCVGMLLACIICQSHFNSLAPNEKVGVTRP
jgi:hypothetical protein